MFTERPQDQGIIFVGHHVPGKAIKQSISAGDSVTLRIGEERVLVRNVAPTGRDRFKGTIYGFEPSVSLEHGSLKLEQEVQFQEQHVFGCS
ncbi:hypothetical protein [Rhodanobacter sp. MP1X3]|uniref:hypothetical protein n=1 Tax=Rhodanobacter sp. MP1X3 TaxID=2723086 RepID=UPI001609D8D3|nr:hypothetical protein [Rhodanobacter sp. MP1X3]MBB6243684.1 hypothetical protein [Rhodanobacter sp. MP1X3]